MVTIISDASQCQETYVAAYAFCIIYTDKWGNTKRVSRFGELKLSGKKAGMHILERHSLLNALHIVKKLARDGKISRSEKVVAQLDNVAAISWFQKLSLSNRRKYMGTLNINIRHIKAHSGSHTSRTWVHSRCDKAARDHMRLLRKNLGRYDNRKTSDR